MTPGNPSSPRLVQSRVDATARPQQTGDSDSPAPGVVVDHGLALWTNGAIASCDVHALGSSEPQWETPRVTRDW